MESPPPRSLDALELLTRFTDRTLPKACWTHDAHLLVCWMTLQHHDRHRSVDVLREQIRAYNDATGTANTPTSGYHETLTDYYVRAVAAAGVDDPSALPSHPWCTREAPLRHWTRERLFSIEARRAWCEPDLQPLPWAQRASVTNSGR